MEPPAPAPSPWMPGHVLDGHHPAQLQSLTLEDLGVATPAAGDAQQRLAATWKVVHPTRGMDKTLGTGLVLKVTARLQMPKMGNSVTVF